MLGCAIRWLAGRHLRQTVNILQLIFFPIISIELSKTMFKYTCTVSLQSQCKSIILESALQDQV